MLSYSCYFSSYNYGFSDILVSTNYKRSSIKSLTIFEESEFFLKASNY